MVELAVCVGFHCTDIELLQKSLSMNSSNFLRQGVLYQDPEKYGKNLLSLLDAGEKRAVIKSDFSSIVPEELICKHKVHRLIVVNENIPGAPRLAARNGILYKDAPDRLRQLVTQFPNAKFEIYAAIRNPATFLPALFKRTSSRVFGNLLKGGKPKDYLWSKLFSDVCKKNPNLMFHVYCYEDFPFIWGEVIRSIAALSPDSPIRAEHLFSSNIMQETGKQRYFNYLKERPQLNELQKRRVASAFLDKYADISAIEETIDLPGWTRELIDELTEQYEEDVLALGRIQSVQLIIP